MIAMYSPGIMKKVIALLSLIIMSTSSILYAQGRSDIRTRIIKGPTIELLSVAVENFRMPSGFASPDDSVLAVNMYGVLKSDLQFSLYFNVVEADSAFIADFAKGHMNLDDWIYLGAQMLISGRHRRCH
jgi:hypothetical protein